MKYINIIVIILLFSSKSEAQRIFFCEDFSNSGDPVGAKLVWELESGGTELNILLENGEKYLPSPIIYLFFDKFENSNYYPYDSKAIKIDSPRKWIAVEYIFEEPGKYLVYFQDSKQNNIAQGYITINESARISVPKSFGISLYYENSRVNFCELVIAGKPMNIFQSVSLGANGKQVYVYIKNDKPLNTSKILVNVWRKKNHTFEYDEYVESKKYKIESTWSDTFFKYYFTQEGEYKFSIYNEDEVLIASGFITVRK